MIAIVLAGRATDFKTLDGTVYRDCVVSKVDPDGISIVFTNGNLGGAKLKFSNVGEDLRKQYGYEPVKAAEFEKEELARKERDAATEREALRLALLRRPATGTNNLASTNSMTNSMAQAAQPRPPVQHHPQHVAHPHVRVVHPPAPAHHPPPAVQHHPTPVARTKAA